MTPYTRDAVVTIRTAVNRGMPADTIREELGWPASMFDNVCRRHGIDCRAAVAVDMPTKNYRPYAPPVAQNSRQGLVNTTVTLPPDLVTKLEAYAAAHAVARHQAAGLIVHDYILNVGCEHVSLVGRSKYGTANGYVTISSGILQEDCAALDDEAARRRMKTDSAGVFVKAILMQHFA